MDKSQEVTMSAEVTLNDIIGQLQELAQTMSDSILYLKYSDPSFQEYRDTFRSLLVSSFELSESALAIFDQLCNMAGNPNS